MKFITIFFLFLSLNLFANPVKIKKCQYCDSFFKKCLFYKKSYINNNLICEEKCQFWDKMFKKCHYKTKCQRVKNGFIYTECSEFDTFFKKCILEEDKYLINNREIDIDIKIKGNYE